MHQSYANNNAAIKPLQGYNCPVWKQVLFAACVTATLGASWLLANFWPTLMILLRLQACSVTEASYVKIQLEDRRVLLLRVFTAVFGRSAPASGLKQGPGSSVSQYVQLFGFWYSYNQESDMFVRVPRMPADLHEQLERALPALIATETGGEWADFNPSNTWPRRQRVLTYGSNRLHIPKPSFIQVMWIELKNPLIVLPALEMALWMWSFAYYAYPAVLLGIMLIGTIISGNAVYQQRKKLTAAFSKYHLVPIVHKGFVRAASAVQLIPGDVIVVQQGMAVCDMVLLRGNCLVEEATLTGEALQTRKIPFVPAQFPGAKYDPDVHRSSTVAAGSAIQQVWNERDEQDEVLAMVARTGLHTFVGQMVTPLIDRHWAVSQSELRTPLGLLRQDTLKFFLLAGLVQLIIYLVLVPTFVRSHLSAKSALLQIMLSVLTTVDPLLPTSDVFIRVMAFVRLKKQNILVSNQQKMMIAGHLDVVLFDKTGTLTADQGKLHGIITCESGKMEGLKCDPIAWSTDVKKLIALCHGLVPLSRGKVVGRLDEQKAFACVEAAFLGRSTVCLPLGVGKAQSTKTVKLEILHRFEYDSKMMMSGVIARADTSKSERAQVLIKGAAFEVTQLADPDSLPKDWTQAVCYWTALGYRVLGMVTGRVLAESRQKLGKLNLLNITQHTYGMRLLGFAVISNPLQSDAIAAITELQDRGRLHTIMVTGDHPLTATAVAQATGMLNFKRKHIYIKQPDAIFIRERTAYLPSVSSVAAVAPQPPDRYGQPIRNQSALAVNLTALADFAADEVSSSRSTSLNKIDSSSAGQLLSREPRSRFSSKPLVAKPALPSGSSEQARITGFLQRSSKSIQQPAETNNQTVPVPTKAGSSQTKPVQMELASTTLAHAPSSEPFFFDQLASPSISDSPNLEASAMDAAHDRCSIHDALSFVLAEEGQLMPLTKSSAMTLIAEGHQCIITGPVFEYLLQHAEPVFLETVLRNVAVCARMRSHQKAQLVQLLGTHGLAYSSARRFKGMGHVVGYCGDGVNDVPALQAADVGLAVGASQAVVAAPVVSPSGSVTAICTLIREARCSLEIAFALHKYLVLFGFVYSLMGAVIRLTGSPANSINNGPLGTSINIHQYDLGRYLSLFVSLGFVCIRPSPQLHPVRPARQLVSLVVLGPVALYIAIYVAGQGMAVGMLKRQSWYHPTENQVVEQHACIQHVLSFPHAARLVQAKSSQGLSCCLPTALACTASHHQLPYTFSITVHNLLATSQQQSGAHGAHCLSVLCNRAAWQPGSACDWDMTLHMHSRAQLSSSANLVLHSLHCSALCGAGTSGGNSLGDRNITIPGPSNQLHQ
ncbi:TPA: hypothetical protein ACH3X1_009818 [Trebouxia sp. C0004]